MSRRGLIARLAAVASLAIVPAACGKKGDPEPPPDEKVRFPRKYPR